MPDGTRTTRARAAAKPAATAATTTEKIETVIIAPPRMHVLPIEIIGTAPLVLCKFSVKARAAIRAKQEAGTQQAKRTTNRVGRDFDDIFEGARHRSDDGWDGIPAAAFRAGAISACRLANFKMTIAKLSVFIEADGYDDDDGAPLVRIIGGAPLVHETAGRNADGGFDVRVRPMWREWGAQLRIRFDRDQFSPTDIVNLVARIGEQVGIGEGRADSRNSAGQGWGSFRIKEMS